MKPAITILAVTSCLFAATVATTSSKTLTNFNSLTVSEMCALMPWDTSFLRPNTCDHWVRCPDKDNALEEGSCASGLYYNKELGRCNLADGVSCPYYGEETTTNTNVCANEVDGTFIADTTSENCRGYILCQAHKSIKANCPNELIFNPTSRSCVYSTQYTCPVTNKRISTPACRGVANATRLAHDEHCEKYYVCIDEMAEEHECPVQMAYDVNHGRCVSISEVTCYATAALPEPENTFCLDTETGKALSGYFADSESCSAYYICEEPVKGVHDKEPKHLECALGQYFDYVKLSCRDRLNVRCMLDRCMGNSMEYVNVAGDCQSYGRCSNGSTVGTGRCPDGYYFDERSQGCTTTNHNYIACSA